MNALTLIPERVRQGAYLALFATGVVVGALNVADVNTGKATDVIAYLGTALGLVAAGNVTRNAADDEGFVSRAAVYTLGAIALTLCILALLGIRFDLTAR